MNLVPDKLLFNNDPFQSTKFRRKELCLDNNLKRLLEISFVRHVEMKSVFTFQPKKRLVSTIAKSAKPAVKFLHILFKD